MEYPGAVWKYQEVREDFDEENRQTHTRTQTHQELFMEYQKVIFEYHAFAECQEAFMQYKEAVIQYKEAFMDYKDGLQKRQRLLWNIKKNK